MQGGDPLCFVHRRERRRRAARDVTVGCEQFVEGQGPTEQPSLGQPAAQRDQLGALGFGLHPLCDHLQAELSGQVDHRSDDRGVARVDAEAGDESCVDLDCIER